MHNSSTCHSSFPSAEMGEQIGPTNICYNPLYMQSEQFVVISQLFASCAGWCHALCKFEQK